MFGGDSGTVLHRSGGHFLLAGDGRLTFAAQPVLLIFTGYEAGLWSSARFFGASLAVALVQGAGFHRHVGGAAGSRVGLLVCKTSPSDDSSSTASCSSLSLIDYVVAHELAHLREMNHSPLFCDTVESIFAEFREARDQLQSHPPEYLPVF
ncbi:Zinc metalloprotease [Ralstonia solanacearum UW551]|uniref:Zinc metalloprotease n=1 Tax=Ralstonia solanacearum (strain UW551) TaxID=342110 RepID=A0AB33VKF1_RALSU|nr:Zinc metalloprotease [Ralstonia solanacearum UW551]